jgi:hypothetical protein
MTVRLPERSISKLPLGFPGLPCEEETLEQKTGRLVIESRGSSSLSEKVPNFVAMDFSWLVRSLVDLVPGATKCSFFYQFEGLNSAFHVILGVYEAVKQFFAFDLARKIGDRDGVIDAAIELTRASVQTGGGAAILIYRPMAIITAAKGVSASSLFGRVTYAVGQLVTLVFGVFYGLCGIIGARNLFKLIKFYNKYYACTSESEKHKLLVSYLESQEEIEKLKNGLNDDKTREKFIKEAKKILPLICENERMRAQVLSDSDQLANIGCIFAQNKLKMTKEAQLTRLIGHKAVRELKDPAASGIVEINRVAVEKIVLSGLAIVYGVLGLATSIAALIFTGPLGIMLVTLVMIVTVILPMSITDAYCQYVDLRDTAPKAHDKKYLLINTVVALIVTGLAIAFTSIFSFGIVPILLTLLVSGFWLCMNAVIYINILKFEKNQMSLSLEETNPNWLEMQELKAQ